MSINKLTQQVQEPRERSSEHSMWITLGPLLIMVTLTIFLAKYSLLLACLGLVVSANLPFLWRFHIKGIVYSVAMLLISFVLVYAFHEPSYRISWILFWSLALCIGLVVTALCAREYHVEEDRLKEEEGKRFRHMEMEHQSMQKEFHHQVDRYQEKTEHLEKQVKCNEKEIAAFKQLVIASKEEADKYFMQCEHLNEEVLQLHRKLNLLEEEEIKEHHLEVRNKELLKKLNEARVECYQYKVLVEQTNGIAALAQKEGHHKQVRELGVTELHGLETERTELKKIYQQHFRDYQALSDKLQTFFTLDELAYYTQRNISFERVYEELKKEFGEKGKKLQGIRLEIFKAEGAILQLKKALKLSSEEGSSPGSYLAVADQECLRLEEENALLLQLLSQTLPMFEKKKEVVKEPLESHNHFE
jgi:hypothetical protein